ncbi:HD domain-containing protein [Altericista sp. CCNU0014]|uniref:HD domain-containing protein n=1 Tax=Altericista sp. CCNU0014 TaxID=3082949 RepID=UPI00384DA8F1
MAARLYSRTYHDPLHGAITLDAADPTEALLIQLIDTPAFQRLRRIRQLGPASLTFHGAEGSRFTHSLGVMYVARRVFDRLAKCYPELLPHRTVALCAALLHDLGHGPFSHTCEEIFQGNHEQWTRRILQESPEIQALLAQTSPTLAQDIIGVYRKQYPLPMVNQMVTSQLDCDRLDYLMRDSYFTGASYGRLDLDRIVLALDYDPQSQQLVVVRKGLAAIEHYLIVRYFMYVQVYNHSKNIAAGWLLERIMHRARQQLASGTLEADATLTAWLTQSNPELTLKDYLAADDGVFLYHVQRWCESEDEILRDLSARYRDRNLFKAKNISQYSAARREILYRVAQATLEAKNLDPDYYASLQFATTRGYTLYQSGIQLQTGADLTEISELSPLVQTLIQPLERAWLIYPREIEPYLPQGDAKD